MPEEKPIKRGYKVWMWCDKSGYACQFDIYVGKAQEAEKNLGEKIVKRLSKPLYDKIHIVHMDNYFTSYELLPFFRNKKCILLWNCKHEKNKSSQEIDGR